MSTCAAGMRVVVFAVGMCVVVAVVGMRRIGILVVIVVMMIMTCLIVSCLWVRGSRFGRYGWCMIRLSG